MRFADNAARVANRTELNAIIDARTRTNTVTHWIEVINEAGCPCGRVMQLNEVVNDPQVLAQRMVIESVRDGRAPIRMTGFPVKLSATPCELRRPAPELGEHSEEILAVPRSPVSRGIGSGASLRARGAWKPTSLRKPTKPL